MIAICIHIFESTLLAPLVKEHILLTSYKQNTVEWNLMHVLSSKPIFKVKLHTVNIILESC